MTNTWEGGYITEFKVKNGTAQAIDDWTIRMKFKDNIVNIWNADKSTQYIFTVPKSKLK